ncbi:hypothetical protein H6504_00860 [Candidatus Woesearchaeota archaeon]|nr:hypothetical protein [Candidatus Woesearchaeota archaeon]
MARKRERITIIYDILKAIQDKGGKARPTHILYKSNLSSQMLKDYLGELAKNDFVEEQEDGKGNRYFHLTQRGYKYLAEFGVISSFMQSFGIDSWDD